MPCLSLLNPSDVTDTDDGSRENSKPSPCEDSLPQPEAEVQTEADPDAEAVEAEADSEPTPELEVEAEREADDDAELEDDADAEPEVEAELAEMDAEAINSSKEAEDDHICVIIPNEDAITLDVDGDDLLETGKHVKLPDPESEKGIDEPEVSAEMGADDDMKGGDTVANQDEGSRGEPTKKDGRDALKKETGDKERDSGKKGPATTGASGQAKRFVFLCSPVL